MGMSFIGSYSGIDQNTIDQLMEAERMPLKKLEIKQINIKEKSDAWKDVNTRLNSLYEKMKALEKSSAFNTKLAKSSDENFVSIDAGNSAAEGRYDIYVERLASSASVIGGKVKDAVSTDGKMLDLEIDGFIKLKNHDGIEVKIDIKPGDTLRDVVNEINNLTKDSKDGENTTKGTGIRATIVDGRIVLADEKTGDRSIELNGGGGALRGLGLSPATIEKEEKGHGAIFHLNGIKIERDSNRVADAIEGIAINLNKAHDIGQTDVVNISADTEKATKLIQDFVDQYNSTMTFIAEKTKAGDPKVKGSGGILAGESSLKRLQSTLRTLVTDNFGKAGVAGSDINDASQIGIKTLDREGTLDFDSSQFLEALSKDRDSVINFLKPETGLGLIERVNIEIDLFISKKDGIIKSQNESFERTQKELAKQIESFEERMVRKEAYYVKTFTALDVAMMKAEDQMGWLIGQIDSMNASKR